jgi:hypothetical protein
MNAIDFSGRASTVFNHYQTEEGDFAYNPVDDTLNSDQQSLRLMFEHAQNNLEWNFHIKAYRQNFSGFAPPLASSSELFRIKPLSNARDNQLDVDGGTRFAYEVDTANVIYRAEKSSWQLGRQAINWGTGRFWQPMNVFGAFAATDLDTDYKAGIDSAVINIFPTPSSSLTTVLAFAPENIAGVNESAAIFYRRQIGIQNEVSFLLAEVLDDKKLGAALEGDFSGIGWRMEAVQTNSEINNEKQLNAIAGLDYQLNTSTMLTLEVFHNGSGVKNEINIPAQFLEPQVIYGLQQHLSERLYGAAFQHELNPLLNVSWYLLGSELENISGETKHSFLHQLSFLYSLSDNADLLFALSTANGKGLNALGVPQSEFGHVPDSASARFRYYF